MKLLNLLVFTLFFTSAFSQKPVSIIFDTDIGPDYDDVGAMALLHALADKGECNILATMASNKHSKIAAVLNIINTYFNRPNVPIGVVRGKAINEGASQKWDSLIVSKYPHHIKNNDQIEDAVILYRKILAAQPDHSVTIVTVGFLTNMSNLLDSQPDEISPLNGKELIFKKVKRLVSMAGGFPNFKEFNVHMDAAASKNVFENWTTPILLSGFEIGNKIFTGLPLIKSKIENSPIKDAFAHSIPQREEDKNGRKSWDQTAVLVAVRGYEKYYTVMPGKMICNEDGSNAWDNKDSGHFYLVEKKSVNKMTKIINRLMLHQPKKMK
ncbi:MAG: nucleoside hydrolase [Saprospiraceae bacterium]|nr:nucleoside hydrolase [Saprospiraceae bacterium]